MTGREPRRRVLSEPGRTGAPGNGSWLSGVRTALTEVRRLQQRGRILDAEALCRRVVDAYPRQPQASHLLGVLRLQAGRPAAAAKTFSEAIRLQPGLAEAYWGRGNALFQLGRLDQAVRDYRKAVDLKPGFVAAHYNLANALANLGRVEDAIAAYRRVLELNPRLIQALTNLANLLKSEGHRLEAIGYYRRVVDEQPDLAEAHYNLANALFEDGRFEEAFASYGRATELRPNFTAAHYNLANALLAGGRIGESIAAYDRVLALDANHADALVNLGNANLARGDASQAAACFERALALDPKLVKALNNLARARHEQGRLEEAIELCRRAIEVEPAYAETHNNLGSALIAVGGLGGAIESYRRALEIRPDFAQAHSNLLVCLGYDSAVGDGDLLAEHRIWAARHGGPSVWPRHRNAPDPERKLRIGYVSADFRRHPVGYFLAAVLPAHDRAQVDVYCYSGHQSEDALTARLKSTATVWRSTVAMPDRLLAAQIQKDGIDILIDLSGHTSGNRLTLFALKPAPVQVAWLGYPFTTGLQAIDYVIMDDTTVPAGTEPWFVERVVHLPQTRLCYAPPEYAPPVSPLPVLARGYPTFGSFNNTAKLTLEALRLWAAVLRAVPDARLVLKWRSLDRPEVRARYERLFADEGISPDRLDLRGASPHAEMLAQYAEIDVALDPFPFSGGLTSLEALWQGVPVVTLPGSRPVSRQTLGFLGLLELDCLAASDENDYVGIAAALLRDHERLATLRRELRDRMRHSPLCDGARLARRLEFCLRDMWREWCASQVEAVGRTPAEPKPDASPDQLEHAQGVALRRQGRLPEALFALDLALALRPDRADTHCERGIVLQQQGRNKDAITAFDRALELNPRHVEAHHGRGIALRSQGRLGDALAAYDRALRLRPTEAAIHNGRGLVLRTQGRISEALDAYDRALELQPDFAEALLNRGNALKDQARFQEALAAYRAALRSKPNWPDAESNYLFCLNYDPAQDDASLAETHCAWGAQHPPSARAFTTHANSRDPNKTLRVGLVSADFGRHPVGYFLDPLLAAADPASVQYVCYSARPRKDDLTERLQANAHAWRSTIGVSDRDLAELIRADDVDILTDLAGHTAGNRLGCFALRPAPVQVHWAGYCHSVPSMDYSVWDPIQVPEGEERWFVERIIRLPDVRWCYAAPEYAPPVSDPPVQQRDQITFGSFNNLTKVSDHVIDLWVQVLEAAPCSRLLLSWRTMADPRERGRITEAFLRRGLASSRLDLRPGPGTHAGVLAEYAEVDIALDTFPFSGCLTTCEALWMGVPVVTWPHTRPASRQSQAFLSAIGRSEWIARDRQDYVRIATSLAAAPDRLAEVRRKQRARMEASPVCDGPRFARNLEAVYRQIWREWSCRDVG